MASGMLLQYFDLPHEWMDVSEGSHITDVADMGFGDVYGHKPKLETGKTKRHEKHQQRFKQKSSNEKEAKPMTMKG